MEQVKLLLRITRTEDIARRYFVVNGFDGALTMLGLIIGFLISSSENIDVIINVCLGAAIALGVSGMSSAYVSEVAERKRALDKLEEAMVTDLQNSAHGQASRWMPILVALVNGLAPLIISLLILIPLWLAGAGTVLPLPPLHLAIIIALFLIFLLGVFLGRIAGTSWLRSGIQTLLVALLTISLIYLIEKS
ncbi:VIT family protein [Mariprofundus micogutta]|uniref:VIT family protein n=1 Tax=Mariprofundus micogutta TaxID=1921010 RepID=A0A1L8CM67_9PROT|nr:VIT1/CCC1 transporter family protein [Mariprofundus micogutta]GAV19994.1 VIT family protein [Mariprofundus micogutta]